MSNSNARVAELMREFQISRREVAEVLGVSPRTVDAWLQTPGAVGWRNCRPAFVRLLEVTLKGKK